MSALPRVGLLGGAFDPPHAGHLTLARAAIEALELERLLVIPTGQAPHKRVQTPAETRCRLAAAAFAEIPQAELCRYEIERDRPSYTVETLAWTRERYGAVAFVIGTDEFCSFLSWRDPEGILASATLVVGTRPGYEGGRVERVRAELARRSPKARIVFCAMPPMPDASRELRALLAAGGEVDGLLPASVAALIAREHLYGV